MDKKNKISRTIIFVIGLFILSLGIVLNTKTALGISPINSVPYNIHILSDIPLGVCVYINNVFLLFFSGCFLARHLDHFSYYSLLQV